MAADPALIARLDELVALFNRKGMDLPDGLFDRRTQFLLNGAPFESLLGRDPNDPLVLMLARGPAGYRFAAKALQHAVPDARVERGEITQGEDGTLIVPLWLSGRARGTADLVETVMHARFTTMPGGSVIRADLEVDPAVAVVLKAARLRE